MPNYDLENLPHQVLAYYHPFYGTPAGPTGRWLTWNEPLWLSRGYGLPAFVPPDEVKIQLQHDPETFVGPGRRSNYSAFYPTIGLYDCLDPSTLKQHALWAVEASLNGFLWDYMLVGEDNSDKEKPLQETIYDRSLRLMLKVLDGLDAPLSLCPWYDSYCWYGFPAEKIAEHLSYLVNAYHGHPRMIHFDNRLAVFLYATFSRHSIADWWSVRKILKQNGCGDRIFLVAGEVAINKPDLCETGLFEGFGSYGYDTWDWAPEGVARLSRILRELAGRNGCRFWAPTVGPGFDGRSWHHPGRVVTRGMGKVYEAMWKQVIKEQPRFVTVCSFNEWGEGTQIEPCVEYDDLYLKLTAKWAGKFLQREGASRQRCANRQPRAVNNEEPV